MRTFEVKIWEHGKGKPLVTSYSGNVTRKEVADFFGCNEQDVDRYEITEK